MPGERDQTAVRRQELVGAWRLLGIEGRSAAGAVNRLAGDEPVGLLLVDPAGYLAVVYMRRGRPRFTSGDPLGGTPEEVTTAFQGFDAIGATYTVDEAAGRLTYHVVSCRFPNWEGTDQVRRIELAGDRLRLSSPPIVVGGTAWTVSATWQRAGASGPEPRP